MAAIAERADRKMTVADFMALGEGSPFAELIHGNIVMAPSPFRNHQRVIQRTYQLIQNHLDRHPSGEAYLAPFDVHFGENDVLCPDLSFFPTGRCHLLSDRGAEGAPDLLIEVLSPLHRPPRPKGQTGNLYAVWRERTLARQYRVGNHRGV